MHCKWDFEINMPFLLHLIWTFKDRGKMERYNTALFSPAKANGSVVCKSSLESLERGKLQFYIILSLEQGVYNCVWSNCIFNTVAIHMMLIFIFEHHTVFYCCCFGVSLGFHNSYWLDADLLGLLYYAAFKFGNSKQPRINLKKLIS